MSGVWRIDDLMRLAAEALALATPTGQSSGRVRDVPDVRTIRYYTTIGLLDRPAEMRGRTAYYGQRHLKQLVAIKRLQIQGLSLLAIQETLAGVSAKKLDQLAALPAGFIETALGKSEETRSNPRHEISEPLHEATAPVMDRGHFWCAAPDVTGMAQAPATRATRAELPRRQVATIVPLDVGVSLILEGIAPEQLNEEVVASLQPAVAMLRESLVRAGLSGSNPPGDPAD